MDTRGVELTTLLIAPDRELADELFQSLGETRAFQIIGDLKSYPSVHALETRLRQLRPDVVLLDLGSNLNTAGELITAISSFRPVVQIVGLHRRNDPQAIVSSLRLGASEFLSAPFSAETQREAVARLCRLRTPEADEEASSGQVLVFSSTKPGSGASTLAAQTAFALRKHTGKRVLLADFDLMGGTIGFYLKMNHGHSLLDALRQVDRLDPAVWSSLTTSCAGVDVLTAPEVPYCQQVEHVRLQQMLAYARMLYDWVILDLPAIFHHVSLISLTESDLGFLVSTSELPSLHLTRKAMTLLNQVGIEKNRYQVVINRVNKRDNMSAADFSKIFQCPVHTSFPNDYFSLHRAVTLGQPLGADCDLGRAIDSLAGQLCGASTQEKRKGASLLQTKPALSQT